MEILNYINKHMLINIHEDTELVVNLLAAHILESEYDNYENKKACDYMTKGMHYLMGDGKWSLNNLHLMAEDLHGLYKA